MKIISAIGMWGLLGALLVGCSSGGGGGFGSSGGTNASASGGSASSGSATPTQDDDSGNGGGTSAGSAMAASSGSASGTASSSSGSAVSSGSPSGGSVAPTDAGGADASVGVPANNAEIDYTQTKTMTMDTFTVGANQEVYKCQDFANPWGKQVDIKTYVLDMAEGSHHMFAFYKSGASNAPVTNCPSGGLEFGPFTFTSQQHNIAQTYPPTIGATIPQGTGFTMMVHYLNASSAPIMSHVVLAMAIAKPSVVTEHAGVMYLDDTSLVVPPGMSTSKSTYTLPQDIKIMTTWSHMHQQATNFVATTSTGTTLFTTTEWAEPPAKDLSPPLALTKGTSISWSCTYDNMTKNTLTFGQSAQTNVMCISLSVFYPVSDVNDPVIGMP
jgi:hypothetical protein